jgi:6-phosphogluconate dehydrogenase
MLIGLVGLGKMGGNMRERLRRSGHSVVGFAKDPTVSDVESLQEMVTALSLPRVVWVMIPSGEPTRTVVSELAELLSPGDVIIDGGNSRYTDDIIHADLCAAKKIGYLDCGVSGGVWGLDNGYGLMVGGSLENVALAQPIFDALRPTSTSGYVHAGPVGAGHLAKMVHNGIEYGLMQAYAEGYEILTASPLIDDVPAVFAAWTEGTVIRSWLLDLLVKAITVDPGLAAVEGKVDDSGEGRWTIEEAINLRVPVPVISAALFSRFASRQVDSPAMKAVAALRHQFGGHTFTPKND